MDTFVSGENQSSVITWSLIALAAALLAALWLNRRSSARRCRQSRQRPVRLPPGRLGLPLLGETIDFLRLGMRGFYESRHAAHGHVFKTRLWGMPLVRVRGAANIAALVSTSRGLEPALPPSARQILGDACGLVTAVGSAHDRLKRRLAPHFSAKFLAGYAEDIGKTVRRHLDDWARRPSVAVMHSLKTLVLEVALRHYLGRCDPSAEDIDACVRDLDLLFSNLFCLPINLPGFALHRALKARKRLSNFLLRRWEASRHLGPEGCGSLAAFVADSGLTDSELVDLLLQLLFASYDTLVSASCSLLHNLCRHPQVLGRLTRSVTQHCAYRSSGADGAPCQQMDFERLQRDSYLEAVLAETLRLSPPVGGLFRRATRDIQLGEVCIPRGWLVICSIQGTHLMCEAGHEFRPDRWMAEDAIDSDEGSLVGETGSSRIGRAEAEHRFLAYGFGRTRCLGRQLSGAFLKLFCGHAVTGFNFDLVDPIAPVRFVSAPTPQPVDGMPMVFKARVG